MYRGRLARSFRQQQQQQPPAVASDPGRLWPLPASHVGYPLVTGLHRHHIPRQTSPSPDSLNDLVFSLQQAVHYQMGASSSRDLRGSASGGGSTTAAYQPPGRNKKLLRQYARTASRQSMNQLLPPPPTDRDVARPVQMDVVHAAHQPVSATSAPPSLQPTVSVQTGPRQPEGANNVNEAHNNFAVMTQMAPVQQQRGQLPSLRLTNPPPPMPPAAPSHGIKVVRLKVAIDKRLTVVDERSAAVLKYKTPHFRALATVEIPPLLTGQKIQVGWIQVCRDMQFVNVYGREGMTSWEFPEIVLGKYRMISDADGKQYPWYGSKTEVQTLEGPTLQPTLATIHMNDNFFPQVTWYIPHSDYSREPTLDFIYRKQRFYTFLALRDLTTNVYQILKTVAWMMELAIQVEPSNPLGERSKVLGPAEQERPYVLDDASGVRLEKYALNPPNANNSQVLVWRPRTGDAKVIVPPVQTTIDVSRYLTATRDQYAKLKQLLSNTTNITASGSAQ